MRRTRLLGVALIALAGLLMTPGTATPSTTAAVTEPASPVATEPTFTAGFESGGLSRWSETESAVVQDREVFSGSWAARTASNGESSYLQKRLATDLRGLTATLQFKVIGFGSNRVRLITLQRSGGDLLWLFVTRGGRLALGNAVTGETLASNRLVDDGRWHRLRLTAHIVGAASSVGVRVDGSRVGSLTGGTSLESVGIRAIQLGDRTTSRRFDVAFDDVYVSTSGTTSPDPVIAASGDIACDPADSGYNEGAGTSNRCRQQAVSDLLTSRSVDRVLPLGDLQYESGRPGDFQASYNASWGRVLAKTSPVVGNHEYGTPGAEAYFDYFGSAAGPRGKGYYSYDLGTWHVIALNSNCSAVGGCGEGSAQNDWLEADLAASAAQCTLAYWHHPRFSSGNHGDGSSVRPFWVDLYAAGADVVLNGHDHHYERFSTMDVSGSQDPSGIREFVVGTGGKSHYRRLDNVPSTSQVRNFDTFGVLEMTLSPTSYSWEFVPEAGKTFSDSGSTRCH